MEHFEYSAPDSPIKSLTVHYGGIRPSWWMETMGRILKDAGRVTDGRYLPRQTQDTP